jgi:hypothetical protein
MGTGQTGPHPQDAVEFQSLNKFARRKIAEDCGHDESGSGIASEFIDPKPESGRKVLNTALGWFRQNAFAKRRVGHLREAATD